MAESTHNREYTLSLVTRAIDLPHIAALCIFDFLLAIFSLRPLGLSASVLNDFMLSFFCLTRSRSSFSRSFSIRS